MYQISLQITYSTPPISVNCIVNPLVVPRTVPGGAKKKDWKDPEVS